MAKVLRHSIHSNSGSAISEAGPALFLLIFFAIFPILNFILMGFTYCSCVFLNSLELREAARTPQSQLPSAIISIQQNWQSSIIGQCAGLAGSPETDVGYNNSGAETYVTVSTQFTAKSLINIPFLNHVPGLGAPWTCTIASTRVLEDPSYASF